MIDSETFRWVMGLLIPALAIVLFWNFRSLKAEMERMSLDLQAYKLHSAEHYAKSADLKELIDAVFRKLDRIEDKLDHKADKT